MMPGPGGQMLRLAQRRAQLVAQAQKEREAFGQAWTGLTHPLGWTGAPTRVLAAARAHPLALAVPVVALALWRPRWLVRAALAAASLARLWVVAVR